MNAIEVLRERKRNNESLTPLELSVLNDWYIESQNDTKPAPKAEAAAEQLQALYTVVGAAMVFVSLPDDGISKEELKLAIAALKDKQRNT